MDRAVSSTPALPVGTYAIVPMRNVVLFPHLLMPVTVGRPRSLAGPSSMSADGP